MQSQRQTALVTGADGFIGSHLVELLAREGYAVRALTQYNSFSDWGWLEALDVERLGVEVVSGDVRDPAFCRSVMRGADTVFHLAALIAIPYSYAAPDSYIDTNVRGTLNICQAARELGVRRLIHTSTSEVYGTAQYVPIDEQHPLQAQSPYSASKIGADAIAHSFYAAFSLPVTIARPFNTYGPRQSARAVIPTIISQIAAGKRKLALGDLRPTRDLNYVEDTCRGFLALARCDAAIGETVNMGSNREISIGALLALIANTMGVEVEVEVDEQRLRPARSEVLRLWCDNRKMVALTGHAPAVSLEEGIQRTVKWFSDRDNLALYKSNRYNT